MKRLLCIVGSILFSVSASAQQIKGELAQFDDYKILLNDAGYEAFSFDLKPFLNDRYNIALVVKEFERGTQKGEIRRYKMHNKLMVSDFDQQDQLEITDDQMVDPATKTFRWAEKLIIGRYPSGIDSVSTFAIDIPELMHIRQRLDLRAIEQPEAAPFYWYVNRPFMVDTFELGKFIPLVLHGSGWYDAKLGMARFCGESEIAPDMSSEIIKDIPHYFVFGIELTKQEP